MVARHSVFVALLTLAVVAFVCPRAGAQGAAPSASSAPSPSPAPAQAEPLPAASGGAPAPATAASASAPPKKIDKAALLDAKRAYSAGELSYQAGDYKSAILNFRDAQAHIPSPHASYWLAMSLKADGQIPAAIAEFESFLANPKASKVGETKVTEARAELEILKRSPGNLSITTDPSGASVAVDGDVRPGVTPLDVDMTPGKHTITISFIGYQSMEIELEMPSGSKGEQTFKLEKNPEPPPVAAATPESAPKQEAIVAPPPPPPPPRSMVPAYVLFGLAGASAVTGAVFGGVALADAGKFNDNPTNESADSAERAALAADIAFGAAITLGLAGTAYLLAPDSDLTRKGGQSQQRHFALAPYAAPRSAGATARWSF
jgi:hypothetical protein